VIQEYFFCGLEFLFADYWFVGFFVDIIEKIKTFLYSYLTASILFIAISANASELKDFHCCPARSLA